MNLIIGLGNPGEEYKNNRHNVGFMVVDTLASRNRSSQFSKKLQSEVKEIGNLAFAKPQTFMNSSGVSVKKLIDHYGVNISELWVIHDDLDIKLGEYKIQFGKGPKVHNGITSIEEEIGTKDFWRVRIGVDNRGPDNRISGEEYVLQDFTKEEREVLDGVIRKLTQDLMRTFKG